MIRRFTVSGKFSDGLGEAQKAKKTKSSIDDYNVHLEPPNFKIHPDEFEEAKSQGLFKGLSIDDKSPYTSDNANDEECKGMIEKRETQENLNNLVLKRIDFMMKQAESRNPLSGTKHQERVKEIREGKFKI